MEKSDKQSKSFKQEVDFRKVWERKITFTVLTFVFALVAFVFHVLEFNHSDFLMQLFLGITTGCLVVAMQENVKFEQLKQ